MPRDLLYERINQRVDQMFAEGLVEEVKKLRAKGYQRGLTSMQAIGYKEIMSYLDGEITFEYARDWIKQGTRNFAKRQLSWFRRLPEIEWFDMMDEGAVGEIRERVAGKFLRSRE